MLFPTLEHEGDVAAKKKSLELIRVQAPALRHGCGKRHAEKAQATAMSVRYAIAYELSEAAIELNERIEIKNRLRFHTSASGFTLWMNPFEFLNERMASCFERLPLFSSYLDTGDELHGETDDEEDEEAQRNLKHLEMLVPQLAAELRLLQRSLATTSASSVHLYNELDDCNVTLNWLLFKDRLADQLLQIMLTSEKLKNERMQQLFAEVDKNT
ncbi:hypothetical protein GQ600_20056 [Phytophthora cactorum]|nr:hypothetical protein GQ600_20056 [Phytophthora cactorum]